MARLRSDTASQPGADLRRCASLPQSGDQGEEVVASSAWDTRLYLPPWVPAAEAAQVEQRLDGWVAELLQVRSSKLRPSFPC